MKSSIVRVEVLISCMYQKDTSIIQASNIQSDVLVVNQCGENKIEEFDFCNKRGQTCHARIIHTTERGLSRSRNLAIKNAVGDICILCDDDEVFSDDYPEKISRVYEENPNYDVIAFMVGGKYANKKYTFGDINLISALKISSIEITFKRLPIIRNNISFDTRLGSGTGHGAGEENKFIYDCMHARLRIKRIAYKLCDLLDSTSLWHKIHDQKYFFNHGWSNRIIFSNNLLAFSYIFYFILFHKFHFEGNCNKMKALFYELKGYFSKEL